MTSRPEILYKVIEVSPVSEETLEVALNERSREGWNFESMHFVMREGSHRPAMAYLFFTNGRARSDAAQSAPSPED